MPKKVHLNRVKGSLSAGWVSNASLELPSPLLLASLGMLYPSNDLHHKKSENLTIKLCLHCIARPLRVSVFPTHISVEGHEINV